MANEYLQRFPTSTGNRRVGTISAWYKHNSYGTGGHSLFSSGYNTSGTDRDQIDLVMNAAAIIQFEQYGYPTAGGSLTNYYIRNLNRRERDYSSWAHILVAFDTTQPVLENRAKLFINGIRIDNTSTSNIYAQNYQFPIGALTNNLGIKIGNGVGATQYGNNYYFGQLFDYFYVDGQSLDPEVFGFYKNDKGYISAGSLQSTDFRNGQWVPKKPSIIIKEINDDGGFGVNGFYLPLNDSSNFGADFHCEPNSIIKLKGETLPQPRNGAPITTNNYVDQLRTDSFKDYLVLAVPGISTSTSPNLIKNGSFDNNIGGWVPTNATLSWGAGGKLVANRTGGSGLTAYQIVTTTVGQRYTLSAEIDSTGTGNRGDVRAYSDNGSTIIANISGVNTQVVRRSTSFVATTTSTYIYTINDNSGICTFDDLVLKPEGVPLDYSANIKGSGTNKTLTASGNAGIRYDVPSYYGSALGFDGDSDIISIPDTEDFEFGTGDYTVEFWVNCQRAISGTAYYEEIVTKGYPFQIYRNHTGAMFLAVAASAGGSYDFNSSFGIPGVGDWAHICIERYSGRTSMYLNGVVGNTTTASVSIYNSSSNFSIGDYADSLVYPFNGFIQDLRVYKGVAKYKGGFDVPKPFNPVKISPWRTITDTSQNNFASLDYFNYNTSTSELSQGNLRLRATQNNGAGWCNFMLPNSGKYYFELYQEILDVTTTNYISVVAEDGTSSQYRGYGEIYENGLLVGSRGDFPLIPRGTFVGVACDMDNKTVSFYNNGNFVATTKNSSNFYNSRIQAYLPRGAGSYPPGDSMVFNFGQNPTFSGNTVAGTYADANNKGLFKYQPPTGFLALCEDNLPKPTIEDPGKYFKTVLWTGDGSDGRNITGLGFKPDLVWIKSRSPSAYNHRVYDAVRGTGKDKFLLPNSTAAESDGSNLFGGISSFDPDGFTMTSGSGGTSIGINEASTTYVAWCWRAGNLKQVNSNGTISSVISKNEDSGFSIVSYTGTGANATVGHGLGKVPKFIMIKNRSGADGWINYHSSIGPTGFLQLNTTGATSTLSTAFNNTSPTSNVFSVGTLSNTNASGLNYIAYCWAEIEGYSKFGLYTGNGGTTSGPFIICGFKPAFVLIKRTNDVGNWQIYDSSRGSVNPENNVLLPNSSNTEASGAAYNVDFLSTGFALRSSDTDRNANASTYIFAAFAESPFKYANSK